MTEYSRDRGESKGRLSGRRGARSFPYREAVWAYRELGWTGTIPVTRRGTKAPLAKGVTGHSGTDPTQERIEEFLMEFPHANIGLRLPWDVIGIDVDAYDGRAGGLTLARLEQRLGRLPLTWRSTSRDDGISGIYLFHAPRNPAQVWMTDLGPGSGIEIAQFHHRFATVEPSVHNSTGAQYRWWRGGSIVKIPRPGQLPTLPFEWGNYLLSKRQYNIQASAMAAETAEWYARVSGGAMCKWMAGASDIEAGKIRVAIVLGGLHDTLIAAVTYLCTNAAEGHRGLDVALSVVEDAFKSSGRRRNLLGEWAGAVNTAMAKAAALPQEPEDVCSIVADWRRTS